MNKRIVKTVCAISSPEGVFGEGNELPWVFGRPNEDFKRFMEITGEKTGGTVIMTRPTWESLPDNQRPLKGRQNIVVTRNISYTAVGAEVCYSLEEALELASSSSVSIIGGRELVKEALAKKVVDEAYITVVYKVLKTTGQTKYFPELLDQRFFYPLATTSVQSHDQPLAEGGFVRLSFLRYERTDL